MFPLIASLACRCQALRFLIHERRSPVRRQRSVRVWLAAHRHRLSYRGGLAIHYIGFLYLILYFAVLLHLCKWNLVIVIVIVPNRTSWKSATRFVNKKRRCFQQLGSGFELLPVGRVVEKEKNKISSGEVWAFASNLPIGKLEIGFLVS